MAGPLVVLTRHFAGALLAPPVLTDLGVDYLRRTLASLFAIVLVIGLFLPRAYSKKYIDLGALLDRTVYDRALQADTLLMITVPMLLIGLLTVVLAPMLFPDETDYRVLTPLPITRAQIFTAKLAALLLVMSACVLALALMASFWFPLVTHTWRVRHPFGPRLMSHAMATVAATFWMFTAIMAVQGVSLVLLPRTAQRRVGLLWQASMVVGLLAMLPLVFRIPTLNVQQSTVVAPPLLLLPPVWFLGLQQTLLEGELSGGYAFVATFVPAAFAATLLIILLTYAVLYRSAERLASSQTVAPPPSRATSSRWAARAVDASAARYARRVLIHFIWVGLTRSRLHQFVLLLIVGAGVSLPTGTGVRGSIATPLLFGLAMAFGLRTVFLLPLDRAAAWAFRLTETPERRRDTMNAVAAVFITGVVAIPLAVAVITQSIALGPAAALSVVLTGLALLVLVEVVVTDWRRMPFTCSYLPGKRVLAYTLGVLFASYAVFVYVGGRVIAWGVGRPARILLVGGAFLALYAAARRARLRSWGAWPLEFEDSDPTAARPLVLTADDRRT
jgi:hypothetical protein